MRGRARFHLLTEFLELSSVSEPHGGAVFALAPIRSDSSSREEVNTAPFNSRRPLLIGQPCPLQKRGALKLEQDGRFIVLLLFSPEVLDFGPNYSVDVAGVLQWLWSSALCTRSFVLSHLL